MSRSKLIYLFLAFFSFLIPVILYLRAFAAYQKPFRPLLRPELTPYLLQSDHGPPTLIRSSFYAASSKTHLVYSVLLPPNYSKSKTYPSLVWLHGANGGSRSLVPLSQMFYKAMQRGSLRDTIIFFPESHPLSMWTDSRSGTYPIETIIINDLIPHWRKLYPLSANRHQTSIAGFSMGGYGAAKYGLKYPQLFGTVLLIGSGTLDEDLDNTPMANTSIRDEVFNRVYGDDSTYFYHQSPRYLVIHNLQSITQYPPKILFIVGAFDQVLDQNQRFYDYLKSHGITSSFRVLPHTSHDLQSYLRASRNQILDFLTH